jgi:hypothetical protein
LFNINFTLTDTVFMKLVILVIFLNLVFIASFTGKKLLSDDKTVKRNTASSFVLTKLVR